MKTSKEVNHLIANLAGDAAVYDIQYLGLDLSDKDLESLPKHYTKMYDPECYASDLTLAIDAAKRIADKNNYTFVLQYVPDSGEWKASFGDYRDCAEYSGGHPAYCTCMSILKFYGKA